MKKQKNPGAKPFKDFWRLISPQDLLSRAGTVMMRKSPKATIWTVGITSSGYLSSYLGLPGFTGLQAIVAPFIVGGGMLGIGVEIKYIPRTPLRIIFSAIFKHLVIAGGILTAFGNMWQTLKKIFHHSWTIWTQKDIDGCSMISWH